MKEKEQHKEKEFVDNTKYIKVQVGEEMRKSFISYAMAVNVSRAIPDVRDGLKPVHRRILYSMGELNLFNDKPYRKCARIVGDVLGKYHPHGDSAVYEALVRLAQDFSIRCPLVDGQGNFGSIDGDPAAAQRYTEARLSKIAGEMLREIDKETVNFYPNFDGTLQQPEVLPSRFPNLLVNGADGIAVGMATNIPPHNLNEVIDGVIALIDNPGIEIDDLMKIIPAPDYPTKGIIMGRAAIRNAYRTGRGGITIRARAEIEENERGGKSSIVVTELPYQVNKAKLIEQIAELVKDKKIEGISDIREESDRDGMRIVVEVKKDANAQVVLNMLYKHTPMQIGNGIIFLALVAGEPRILNLKEMLYHYLDHQKEVIIRRTRYDLERAQEKAHILEGLVIALANIDKVIKIIKASQDKIEASQKLCSNFALSERQANAILEMRLQRLTSLEVFKIKEELQQLEALIVEYKSILKSEAKVLTIIKTELGEVREKYGTPRQTEISIDEGEVDIEDLIEKQDVVISLTHFGYIKRLPLIEYKTQKRGGVGVSSHKTKEEDFVENMFVCSTHDDLLFFTNFGKVYCKKAYTVPEAQRNAKGRAIINLLQLDDDESVTAVIKIDENTKGNLIMATREGLIKKTKLEEFIKIRKVGKVAIKLNETDRLICVNVTSGRDEILIASHEGKCIRFSEQDVRIMGRDTQGVRSMKLGKNDYIVDMAVLKNGYQILTITENGYGKRTDPADYRLQSRGGKGIKAGVFSAKTGNLVNLKQVAQDEDVIIIADNGMIIRLRAKEISKIGRDTQGVRIMRIKDQNYKIVCASVTAHQDEEDIIEE
ncbi:MAG: DNA gyrase subunit A [Christensenellaceae bacterium]|jgi:DNA gyrase subunit A|nr:DNA gyrase subunit A [Christensenellaceae bacterium]